MMLSFSEQRHLCMWLPAPISNLQDFPFHRIKDAARFIPILIDTSPSLPAPSLPPTLLLPWQVSLSMGSAGPTRGPCTSQCQ